MSSDVSVLIEESLVRESEQDETNVSTSISTGSFKIIYVYSLPFETHKGILKVGDATYHTDKSLEEIKAECSNRIGTDLYTSDEIVAAAAKRIKQQTGTAGVFDSVTIEAAYLAIKPDTEKSGSYTYFRDYEVHEVLSRSGIQKKKKETGKRTGEWFPATLSQVVEAIKAVQQGRTSITANSSLETEETVEIMLRTEQIAAIRATKEIFKKGATVESPKKFLWNAIMRFGKTLTAYALVKEIEESREIKKVLILTHRPVVRSGWADDFKKSFDTDLSSWGFGSRDEGEQWKSLQSFEKFFYFASIQDLRGSFDTKDLIAEESDNLNQSPVSSKSRKNDADISEKASEIFTKNAEIFETVFDMVIFDESHEGTQTALAKKVEENLKARYKLHLSGTPFNIIEDFETKEVYSWSYIDEQKARKDWDDKYQAWEEGRTTEEPEDDFNPYAKLPKLIIRTYDITDVFKKNPAVDPSNTTFNFAKFFQVDKKKKYKGDIYDEYHQFVNPGAVNKLLNMITQCDENGRLDNESGKFVEDHRNFPFSRYNSKKDFAHSFWILPTVESAIALHEVLNVHPNFENFKVVNATGDNDGGNALESVRDAVKDHERTITLSVGKLTTGTTIPEWTAVFMLSNMKAAMQYLQTIFRVKSSGTLSDGRPKEFGYVFDFAPDRCLEMISESVNKMINRTPGFEELSFTERENIERAQMDEMLTYLPVIAYDGAKFTNTNTDGLMETMKKVYINRAVESGFSDLRLFRFDHHSLTPEDINFANKLADLVGDSCKDQSIKKLVISSSKLSKDDEKVLKLPKPPKTAPEVDQNKYTEAEAKQKEDRENGKKVIKLLRGISARIPLLVFATNFQGLEIGDQKKVKLDNFAKIVDDESWDEFMPKGFDKEGWDKLKDFFDRTVFEGACEEIRNRTLQMDELPVINRVAAVANLFSTFKNPDKETTLTPFSVVNKQYANTLGGLRFVDDDGLWFSKTTELSSEPGIHGSHTWSEIEESEGMLEVSPVWQNNGDTDLQDFWESARTSILDINSKTALYPLYAAVSLWWKTVSNSKHGRRSVVGREYEELVWSEIVENQIFVNCRVPYSLAIAERVLRGYKEEIRVNASVIDIIEVRKVLKTASFPELTKGMRGPKNEDPKKAVIDAAISDIWKWIFNPESVGTRTEDGKMTVAEERAKMILGMAKDKVAPMQALESNETEDEL